MSLATKYRPTVFSDVLGQDVVIKILQRQLEVKQYPHCYLFTGPSGDGKTTIARIMANEINDHLGSPVEIDGASNNGVDNIREIIEEANRRSVNSEYKIFIIDECHQITVAGWNAFLKCIEEPPQYTIFMFCTTDPQKLPATILNRVMRFNLNAVADDLIKDRLNYIRVKEGVGVAYEDALQQIVRTANGSVREAISNLERVLAYSDEITLENVNAVLGLCSYDLFFALINAITDKADSVLIQTIESLEQSGMPCRSFMEQLVDFVLSLNKYCLFGEVGTTKLPASLESDIQYAVGIYPTAQESAAYFAQLADKLLEIRNLIKNDSNGYLTVKVMLLNVGKE